MKNKSEEASYMGYSSLNKLVLWGTLGR